MSKKENFINFVKTLLMAMICAGFVRSFFFEPFHIPSSSMKPNLLIGDYIFVNKYSYGYSRYSFPFGIKFFEGRFFEKTPQRGDVVVFRFPNDPSINYIKRLVGLPGDKIQMRRGKLYINDLEIEKTPDGKFIDDDAEIRTEIFQFSEKLSEEKTVKILDQFLGAPQDDTGIYEVPEGHYFMMGDNRDNSQDSRFLSQVGYVPAENLVGKATIIFFSTQKPIWQIWNWQNSIRFNRIFTKIK
jgi:signal peptidase I